MAKTKCLRAKYNEEVKVALKEKFGYENDHMIPKLHKIVLNMGVCVTEPDLGLLTRYSVKPIS